MLADVTTEREVEKECERIIERQAERARERERASEVSKYIWSAHSTGGMCQYHVTCSSVKDRASSERIQQP